jgi:hypothetical protein
MNLIKKEEEREQRQERGGDVGAWGEGCGEMLDETTSLPPSLPRVLQEKPHCDTLIVGMGILFPLNSLNSTTLTNPNTSHPFTIHSVSLHNPPPFLIKLRE